MGGRRATPQCAPQEHELVFTPLAMPRLSRCPPASANPRGAMTAVASDLFGVHADKPIADL
eukprot:2411452-Pyramimonas_sp.AAC.1